MIVNKKVKLNLVKVDEDAFSIMIAFSTAAEKSKWTDEETNKVLNESMKGDYNHLRATISAHCE